MTKLMKIKDLANYGVPSHTLNIWEKHYPPYLLPIQEEAVREYGVLDYDGNRGLLCRITRNDKKEERRMQYAPTGGIDEIAALSSKARNDKDPHPTLSPQGRGSTRLPRRYAPLDY